MYVCVRVCVCACVRAPHWAKLPMAVCAVTRLGILLYSRPFRFRVSERSAGPDGALRGARAPSGLRRDTREICDANLSPRARLYIYIYLF